jgi:hypothetical protein
MRSTTLPATRAGSAHTGRRSGVEDLAKFFADIIECIVGEWVLLGVLLVSTYGLYRLVDERFLPYLEAIVNCYDTAVSLRMIEEIE